MENPEPRKGVILKIFGVILIFLASLNVMLFWRGGMPVSAVFSVKGPWRDGPVRL